MPKPKKLRIELKTFQEISNAIATASSLAIAIRAFEAADLDTLLGVDIKPVMESMRSTMKALEAAITERIGING